MGDQINKTNDFLRMATNGAKESSYAVRMRAARLSAAQFDVLIEFMRKHPTLALGRAACGSYSKEEHDSLWKSLATMLNDTEGPVKSISKWQKCWVDLKSNARSRAAKLRANIDGSILVGATFTQWDEHVLKLLGEIGSQESTGSMELQNSPSRLVEVPLTSGKVVLMEMNGSRRRANSLNRPKSHELPYKKQNIKVEEPDVNFSLVEAVHDVEQEDEDSTELVSCLQGDEYDKINEDESNSRENDFLLCPPLVPIRTSAPTSGCSPIRNNMSPSYHENDELVQECSKKRKEIEEPALPNDVEHSLENFTKKICAALERVASAAEESNSLQRGMVNALERLSSSLEKIVPALVSNASKTPSSST